LGLKPLMCIHMYIPIMHTFIHTSKWGCKQRTNVSHVRIDGTEAGFSLAYLGMNLCAQAHDLIPRSQTQYLGTKHLPRCKTPQKHITQRFGTMSLLKIMHLYIKDTISFICSCEMS
jgi:hypothetical protein